MNINDQNLLKALIAAIDRSLVEGEEKGLEISIAFEAGYYIGTLKTIKTTLTNMLENTGK